TLSLNIAIQITDRLIFDSGVKKATSILFFFFMAPAPAGIYTLSLHDALPISIIFIEARINLSRFVVTGCAAKTSATVTFPSLNLISLFAFCFNIWLNGVAS